MHVYFKSNVVYLKRLHVSKETPIFSLQMKKKTEGYEDDFDLSIILC